MGRIRLASLKLSGFKSFADPVELVFPSDITAVVGPNGVGKSNLVDAMLWVLGEQSPSLLRLKNMGDLVFAGATGRKPAGAAEVALTLASDDGRWTATEGRITISRRVARNGPSDYRLNGKSVRLRDIADELLRIGLGTRAYAIIGQDRIGRVLTARPTDRRILIEEAAGITHYRARRHEAELRLAQTRQNLQRVDDIIAEVDRSRRQLKRQARQAGRYRELETELKEKLTALYALRARTLSERRRRLAALRADLQSQAAAAASALGAAEADLTAARQRLEQAHADVEGARTRVTELLGSSERLEAFLERSADLLDNLRGSLAAARNQARSLASSRRTLQDREREARSRLVELEQALAAVRENKAAAKAAADEAARLAKEAESLAAGKRQGLLRTISVLTSTRNRLGELERQQDRLAYALSQTTQENERLTRRLGEARERLESARAAAEEAAREAGVRRAERDAVAAERADLAEAAARAGREAEALAHAAWEIKHQLAGIDRELARHAAAVEQVAELLPEGSLAGQVSDYLHPEPTDAPLLDRVWHEVLELPVARLDGLPAEALAAARSLAVRVRVVLAGSGLEPPAQPPVEGAEALLDRAGIEPGDLGWLARVLPPAFVCAGDDDARRLALRHPAAVFVTPAGTLYRGAAVELAPGGTGARGALELRGERERLAAELDDLERRAEEQRRLKADHAARADALEDKLRAVDGALLAAEQRRAATATEERSAGEQLRRLEHELEALAAESDRVGRERAAIDEKRERLAGEIEELQRRNAAVEEELERASRAAETRRDEAAAAVRDLDHWRAEERLAAERVEAARAEAGRLADELARLEERAAGLETEIAALEEKLAATEDEVVRSRARLAEEQGLLAAAREEERRHAEAVEETGARVAALEKEVASRRTAHEQARTRLHETEVEKTRLDAEWERLGESAASELGVTAEDLAAGETGEAPEEELLAAVEGLRAKLDRIGPVNLLAVEEVAELDKRSAFLHEQRDDLAKSLHSLSETIREIDATCSERFVTTFEQVNAVFAETFHHLFGGGTARLDLADEDDPLESGVLITAQPPGKKNQSIQLLSGGERALAALALLISLFRIKPSPVCILDEVDAALDAANITRLLDLIRGMAGDTQFVLITHNRRTMAAADVLYGVTMEKTGVSKIVSVSIER